MTVPNTFSSGVNTSLSTELNANFAYLDGSLTYKDVMTEDTSVYTRTNASFDNVKTYTFTPPTSNNILIGMLVKADIKKYRYTKMWSCECEDPRGKPLLNFKRQHYCPGCGKYQTAHHEQLYNKG